MLSVGTVMSFDKFLITDLQFNCDIMMTLYSRLEPFYCFVSGFFIA